MPMRWKLIQPKTIKPTMSIQAKTGRLMDKSESVMLFEALACSDAELDVVQAREGFDTDFADS